MSRHVSRQERWQPFGTEGHRSIEGLMVRRYKGEWWAHVAYSVQTAGPGEGEVLHRERHFDRLGPFKRPRNAMVEAERHATALRNRHGDWLCLEDAAAGPND